MITPTTSKSTVTNSSGYPNMTLGTNRDFVAERSATKSRKTPRVYSNKSKSPERTRAPARRTGARRRPQRLYYTDPDLMTTGLHEGIRSHEATHPTNAPSKLGFKISRKQLITGFSVLATVMVFSLCCCTDHGKQAIRRLLARNSENPQLLRSSAFTDVMMYDKKMRCVRLDRRRLQNRRRLPNIPGGFTVRDIVYTVMYQMSGHERGKRGEVTGPGDIVRIPIPYNEFTRIMKEKARKGKIIYENVPTVKVQWDDWCKNLKNLRNPHKSEKACKAAGNCKWLSYTPANVLPDRLLRSDPTDHEYFDRRRAEYRLKEEERKNKRILENETRRREELERNHGYEKGESVFYKGPDILESYCPAKNCSEEYALVDINRQFNSGGNIEYCKTHKTRWVDTVYDVNLPSGEEFDRWVDPGMEGKVVEACHCPTCDGSGYMYCEKKECVRKVKWGFHPCKFDCKKPCTDCAISCPDCGVAGVDDDGYECGTCGGTRYNYQKDQPALLVAFKNGVTHMMFPKWLTRTYEKLPEGWTEHNTDSGQTFYNKDGVSQWVRPSAQHRPWVEGDLRDPDLANRIKDSKL